IIWGLVKMNS
ncbi:hypothetical protein BVZ52_00318B, partial [Haemophilus influenzae]